MAEQKSQGERKGDQKDDRAGAGIEVHHTAHAHTALADGRTGRRTDGWTDWRADGRADGRAGGRTDGPYALTDTHKDTHTQTWRVINY